MVEAVRGSSTDDGRAVGRLRLADQTQDSPQGFLVRTASEDAGAVISFIESEVVSRLRSNANVRRITVESSGLNFEVDVYVATWSMDQVRRINAELADVYRSLTFRFPRAGLDTHIWTDRGDDWPELRGPARVVFRAE